MWRISHDADIAVPKQKGWTVRWKVNCVSQESKDMVKWLMIVTEAENTLCRKNNNKHLYIICRKWTNIQCHDLTLQGLLKWEGFWKDRSRIYQRISSLTYMLKNCCMCDLLSGSYCHLDNGCHGNCPLFRWKSCCLTLSFQNSLIIHPAAAAAQHMQQSPSLSLSLSVSRHA